MSQLKGFSIAEKIFIIEELCRSIDANQKFFGLFREQWDESDRHIANNDYSWKKVKHRIKSMELYLNGLKDIEKYSASESDVELAAVQDSEDDFLSQESLNYYWALDDEA